MRFIMILRGGSSARYFECGQYVRFSSDRTIEEYAKVVWIMKPIQHCNRTTS